MSLLQWEPEKREMILDQIEYALSWAEPVVLPTDTLYGLCACLEDDMAVEELFAIKRRPETMTLPIAVGRLEVIYDLADVGGWRVDLLAKNLPGPYTFILNAKCYLPEYASRSGTVAIRVPDHPIWLPLCEKKGPMVLTSANRHGSVNMLKAEEIEAEFGDLLIVKDDAAISGTGSEIVDLTGDEPITLRAGKTK